MAEQSELEQALLEAMDYLVNNRVENLDRDKTITATIVSCSNALTQEYQIQYNNGFLTAYAQEGASFKANELVYVLVPLGDFSQKKTIVGKASNVSDDTNITFVSSVLNNYNSIGRNVIEDKGNNTPIGLNSYYKNDYVLIYDRDLSDESLVSINQDEFKSYLKNASAIMIESTFQTRLPRAHRLTKTGIYGVQFVLAFQDTSSTVVNEYEEYLPETEGYKSYVEQVVEGAAISAYEYYKQQIALIWADPELSTQEKQQEVQKILDELQSAMDSTTSLYPGQESSAVSNFIGEVSSIKNEGDVQEVIDSLDKTDTPVIKHISYVLDSNNMTGNPLLYNTYTNQYNVYPIDVENFLYIESIMAYCQDFESEDNLTQATLWGDDIFIKEFEIYGLQEISAVSGDYMLKLATPQGALFKTLNSSETLTAIGTTTYQKYTDISDSTTYYWFAKDDRISSLSEDYQMYGGAGWRYLRAIGNNKTLTTTGAENRAYENVYMVVAVYKESVILKQTFTFYNEAARRDIQVISDLGTKFSFDRGTPTLTCLINGKSVDFDENHDDELYSFAWSKIDDYGNTTTISKTYKELEAEYEQGIKDAIGYSALAAIKNQMIAMQGVEFMRNVLKYPIKQIDAKATFSCSVYLRETADAEDYFVGSATITLQNDDVASPTDYYILIQNGDQVFQYSESGVSPASDRYTDPLEILPLECHFYDPAGLEVNKDTYTVKWVVPTSDTMLVVPAEGLQINPANGKLEWYPQATYPTMIADSYDYQALNNQVTCVVTYNGQDYQQDTDFLFVKVGDNGTNGTDVVGKISPVRDPQQGLLALELRDNHIPQWNNGTNTSAQALQFELFNCNELLNITSVSWSMAGGNTKSKQMSVSGGVVSWDSENTSSTRKFTNLIVKAETSFESQSYYAFYPVPVIDYKNIDSYSIILDKTKTLKNILYNADGRNPLYNKNQGIFFTLTTNAPKYVTFAAEGGLDDNETSCAFKLIGEKNSSDGQVTLSQQIEGEGSVYILPDDVYDGAYCNNRVHVRIYSEEGLANPEVEFYVPIHMSLNMFGLASLNAWDGNHVEINEDENYVLAPQIGAGEKDDENKFTGIVMGKSQTYDQEERSVGLLGYSHGKQSIWLDADTGNAIFGLPEQQASTNNAFTEGRIELIPGGESKIGMWNIGSRAMYNMTKPPVPVGVDEEGNIEFEDSYIGVQPDDPYKDYPVPDAQISIPHDAQGLLLNANPAYISVKGMPLDKKNSNIDWEGANTTIKQGDSIEVELDPRKSSVFSIYRHTTWDGDTNTDSWHRYPLVGINASGQFYTNAIEDGESSMGIGAIGAFGKQAGDHRYVGAQFAYLGANIFKFFLDDTTKSNPDGVGDVYSRPLYISAATGITSEYERPMQLYGKTIALYSNEGALNATEKTSEHRLLLTDSSIYLGHNNAYISIPSFPYADDEHNVEVPFEISTDTSLVVAPNEDMTTTMSLGYANISTKHPLSLTINHGEDRENDALIGTVLGKINITDFSNLSLKTDSQSGNLRFDMLDSGKTTSRDGTEVTNNQIYLGNDTARIEINEATLSKFNMRQGIQMNAKNNGIFIDTDTVQIDLKASYTETNAAPAELKLTPAKDGYSTFSLLSGYGNIRSVGKAMDEQYTRNGVEITDGVYTGWANLLEVIDGSSDSLRAEGDLVGSNFKFNSAKNYDSFNGWNNSFISLDEHLDRIYDLIRQAYNRAVTAEDNARTWSDNAYTNAINWVSRQGYATQSWVDSNYVTGKRAEFVLANTYNTHKHDVGGGGWIVSAYTGVTIDDKSGSLPTRFTPVGDLSTGNPR